MSRLGHTPDWSRRKFLTASTAGLAGLAIPVRSASARYDPPVHPQFQRLSQNLGLLRGTIHVGVVFNGNEALLIDCGDVGTFEWAAAAGIKVNKVLVTHHHREQVMGLLSEETNAEVLVSAAEEKYFTDVAQYWLAPSSRWHIYNQRPHHWMLPQSVKVAGVLKGGESLTWGSATIKVLETPGHTDGSVSFLVAVDGLRVVFCGDLLYGPGQVPDLYCLQKGLHRGQRRTSDYHGFLGARETVKESLHRVLGQQPDLVVTSAGGVIEKPEVGLQLLIERLDSLYDTYVSTSALRHYFPELFEEFQGRADHLPFRPQLAPPAYLRHIGTSWIIRSQDGAAFVMDCGSPRVIEALEKMITAGEITRVEGLWITHYHDDHVDAVPQFLEKFACPCYTVRPVAEVITRPMAWRLPCISPSVVRVDRVLADGEFFSWHEFRMTPFDFPGQTLYHGALFAENATDKLLFVGDSFTPAGIDDYCIQNRNFLHDGSGFLRCLDLISQLKPTHMFNCHVDSAFTFRPEDCQAIKERLQQRRELLKAILPWRDFHFGTDELWVRCDPYEQTASPGDKAVLDLVILNHLTEALDVHVRVVPPASWSGERLPSALRSWQDWQQVSIAGRKEGRISQEIFVPKSTAPGRYVVMVDIAIPGETPSPRILCGVTEAVIVIQDVSTKTLFHNRPSPVRRERGRG
ncbi:MAG TPA: MBL fold metallo-hydrolase [Thermogutta sp.]|nr:MBL fold metallo-hydrolase [Thermogutta sp.]